MATTSSSFAEEVGGAFDVRGLGDLQTRLRAMSYFEVRVVVVYLPVCMCSFCRPSRLTFFAYGLAFVINLLSRSGWRACHW